MRDSWYFQYVRIPVTCPRLLIASPHWRFPKRAQVHHAGRGAPDEGVRLSLATVASPATWPASFTP